ncbi:MAG: hypothetical protein Q8O25_17030 [Sulfurisoma sp.]|nr:hypothetical protein [Sulfurisoma sp.]
MMRILLTCLLLFTSAAFAQCNLEVNIQSAVAAENDAQGAWLKR